MTVVCGYWLDYRGMLHTGRKYCGDAELTREEYAKLVNLPLIDRRDALTEMRKTAVEPKPAAN